MDRDVHPSQLRGVLADGTQEDGDIWERLDEMRAEERRREAKELVRLLKK